MTIQLTPELEAKLKAEARRHGVEPTEYAKQVLERELSKPDQATIDLLRKWEQDDASDDPAELARREQELKEFKEAMNRNRREMEGPQARKLFP